MYQNKRTQERRFENPVEVFLKSVTVEETMFDFCLVVTKKVSIELDCL